MGGWVKEFADRSFEMGLNEDVEAGKISWSRGRLDGMIAAAIKCGNKHIAIRGIGEYWQSDDFDVSLFTSKGGMVNRRIMKKLRDGDRLYGKLTTENSTLIQILNIYSDIAAIAIAEEMHSLPAVNHDQWLVLEYNIPSQTTHWYLTGDKF